MLRVRVIPALLLYEGSLVKTIQFNRKNYIGDPINTVRIFNDLEVDEIVVLDIVASQGQKGIDFDLVELIASHCFMPLSYGGGIKTLEDAKRVFDLGVEKVIINSMAVEHIEFIRELSDYFGSQSVVVSIDVKKDSQQDYTLYTYGGRNRAPLNLIEFARQVEEQGAGEIILTSIDREGTWNGYDINLLKLVTNAVNIPVIAHGGAGSLKHFEEAVVEGGASAVAAGSMFVYLKKNSGVLINFPKREVLQEIFDS